jgi:cellulose synthase/poly-beta-1,6-N-acetylglucosamine synthase-like glycosyltransferase
MALGCLSIFKRNKELNVEDFSSILHSNALPEITFIVTMFNEEKVILNCIHSLVNLSYRYKQIICVNDGSMDQTLHLLVQELDLIEAPLTWPLTLPTKPIKAVYRSLKHPEVWVIDKEHGGKFDTVNAGINACKNPYLVAVDADTVVDNEGFEALIRPILTYSDTVAVGASVRIKNGSELKFNKVSTQKMPLRFLPFFQSIEYLRAFLQRQGWNLFGGNFVIAGSFSIFQTEIIKKIGGMADTIAEDMEIIIRLHRILKKNKQPYRIFYLPDPVAWTEGPSRLKYLSRQRARWHRGLLESLWFHKSVFFNPTYGWFGLFNFPFWVIGEAFEPIAELLGFVWVFMNVFDNTLNWPLLVIFILITLGFTSLYSLVCLLIEELTFRKYTEYRTLSYMGFLSLIENFGYRQLNLLWRLKGTLDFIWELPTKNKEKKRVEKLIAESFKTKSAK